MPDDKGDMLDATEEELGQVLYRIEDTIKQALGIVEPLPGHVNDLISRIAHLELINAAKVVPETVSDEAEHAGKTLGAAGETVGAGVGTVPAVATDVLEDVGSVGRTTERGGKSIFKKKIRRS